MLYPVDVDLLPYRCRNTDAKQMIFEAVGCFHAGAFRAAIVITWIAVVYDLFGKLRELSLSGDRKARDLIEKIDIALHAGDKKTALRIEQEILEIALKRFELITALEYADLERLYQDRHKCSHPSLNQPEDIYKPSPELVKLHLRNAVEHLLAHPPVQGRAAFVLLQKEVDSEFFPRTDEEAIDYFHEGHFARMKDTLKRSFVRAAISSILESGDLDTGLIKRRLTAIVALMNLYPEVVRAAIEEKLPHSASRTSDECLWKLLLLIRRLEGTFMCLDAATKLRLQSFVEQTSDHIAAAIFFGQRIPELCERATARLRTADRRTVEYLLRQERSQLFLDRAVELYANAESFDSANRIAESLIIPWIDSFSQANLEGVLVGMISNRQVYESNTRFAVLTAIRQTISATQLERLLAQAHEVCSR